MATNFLAGTASLSVDGTTYLLEGAFKYNPSTVKRESLTGQDGVHGYKEMPMAPYITATLRDSGGLTIHDFNAMKSVTVTAELANGKTIVGRGMWTVESQEVDTTEGTLEVRWEGPQVTEN